MEDKDTKCIGEYQFSFFRAPISNTIPEKQITLLRIYDGIKRDLLKDSIDHIRHEPAEGKRKDLKDNLLPYVTFAGVFSKRSANGLIQRSGLIVVDIDHLQDIPSIRDKILSKYKPALVFLSPSWKGLKVVYAIDINNGEHIKYFQALQSFYNREFGIEVDKSGKDICRACYLSYDPNAFYSDQPDILNKAFLDTYAPITQISEKDQTYNLSLAEKYNQLKKKTEQTYSFREGVRNSYIADLAGRCHRYDFSEIDTLSCMREFIREDFTENEIRKIVKSIFSNQSFKGVSIPETKAHYYFSFPLKFLWFDSYPLEPIMFRNRLQEIRNYSTIHLVQTNVFGEGDYSEVYEEALSRLKYEGVSYAIANVEKTLTLTSLRRNSVTISVSRMSIS